MVVRYTLKNLYDLSHAVRLTRYFYNLSTRLVKNPTESGSKIYTEFDNCYHLDTLILRRQSENVLYRSSHQFDHVFRLLLSLLADLTFEVVT